MVVVASAKKVNYIGATAAGKKHTSRQQECQVMSNLSRVQKHIPRRKDPPRILVRPDRWCSCPVRREGTFDICRCMFWVLWENQNGYTNNQANCSEKLHV
jgi:hypothetical protein